MSPGEQAGHSNHTRHKAGLTRARQRLTVAV